MVPKLDIAEIDLASLALIVERVVWIDGRDHSRWVFRSTGTKDKLIYKIWNSEYILRDNLLTGLDSGLYSPATVPALKAIITSDNICRGYVMRAGSRCRNLSPELVYALWEATRRSGYFLAQYRKSHTIVVNGRYSLIDLEAVHPVRGDANCTTGQVNIEDDDYSELVRRLQIADLSAEEVRTMADAHINHDGRMANSTPWLRRKFIGARNRWVRAVKNWTGDQRALIE